MISITQDQLWMMLMSTIRYSFGRQSGMAYECRELTKDFRQHLTNDNLQQIRNEVQGELQKHEEKGYLLGHQTDHEAWRGLVEDLKDLQKVA